MWRSDQPSSTNDVGSGDDSLQFAAHFPIITSPATSILQLLIGNPTPIFTFDVKAGFNADFPIPFGIPGLFDIGLDFNFGLSAELSGGYDAKGLQDFVGDPNHDPGDLTHGFYFDSNSTSLTLTSSIKIFSDVTIVHIDGGIFGTVTATLAPGKSGAAQVRLNDFKFGDDRIFKTSGSLDARAVVSIGIDPPSPLPSVTFFSWTLADISLLPPDFDYDPAAPPPGPTAPIVFVDLPITDRTDDIFVHPYVSDVNDEGGVDQTIGIEVDANGSPSPYPRDAGNDNVDSKNNFFNDVISNFDPNVFAITTRGFDLSGTHRIIVNLGTSSSGPEPFGKQYPPLIPEVDQDAINYIEELPVVLIGGPGDDDLEYTGRGKAVIFGGGGNDHLVGTPSSILVGGPGNNDLEGAGIEVADRVDQVSQSIPFPTTWTPFGGSLYENEVDPELNFQVSQEAAYEHTGAVDSNNLLGLFVGPPPDDLHGQSSLAGAGSSPTLYAGPGGDTLFAATSLDPGADSITANLYGGGGNDVFQVEGAGTFHIYGNGGTNTLDVEDALVGDTLGANLAGSDHMDVSYNSSASPPSLTVATKTNQNNSAIQTVIAQGVDSLSLKPAALDNAIEVHDLSSSPVGELNVTVPDNVSRPAITVTLDGSANIDHYSTDSKTQPFDSRIQASGLVATSVFHQSGVIVNRRLGPKFLPFSTQQVMLLGLIARDKLVLKGGSSGSSVNLDLYNGQAFTTDVEGQGGAVNRLSVDASTQVQSGTTGQLTIDNRSATYQVNYPGFTSGPFTRLPHSATFPVDFGGMSSLDVSPAFEPQGNDISVNQSPIDFFILPLPVGVHIAQGGRDRVTVTDPSNVSLDDSQGSGTTLTINDDETNAISTSYTVTNSQVTDNRTLPPLSPKLKINNERDGTVNYSNIGDLTINALASSSGTTVDVNSTEDIADINAGTGKTTVRVTPDRQDLGALGQRLTVNGQAGPNNSTTLEVDDQKNPYATALYANYVIDSGSMGRYVQVLSLPGQPPTPLLRTVKFTNLSLLTLDAGNNGNNTIDVTNPQVLHFHISDSHANANADRLNVHGLVGQLQVNARALVDIFGPLQLTNDQINTLYGGIAPVGASITVIDNNASYLGMLGSFTNFPGLEAEVMNGRRYHMIYNANDGTGDNEFDDAVLDYDNTAPSITSIGLPATGTEGQIISVPIAFTDPDVLDTHTVTVNWGDGSPAQTTTLPNQLGSVTLATETAFLHSFPASTTPYRVQFTVQDSNNGEDIAVASIRVYDAPLSLLPFVPAFYENTPFNGMVAEFLDLGTSLNASAYQATIHWGDGTSSAGTVVSQGGGGLYTINGSHPGNWAIGTKLPFTVQVTDPDGATTLGPFTWQAGPANADVARQGASALADPDGKIYLVGGTDNKGSAIADFRSYDPATNTWATLPSVPTPFPGAAATIDANGNIYLVGGRRPPSQSKAAFIDSTQVLEYRPASNAWQTDASLPTPTSYAAAVADNGRIYVIGGQRILGGSAQYQGVVQVYDPSHNTWGTLPNSMPTPRSDLAAVVGQDGLIYAIGGTTRGAASLNTVEVLNPRNSAWSTGPSLPGAVTDAAIAVGPLGFIYVIGGKSGNSASIATQTLEPNIQGWTSGAGLPQPLFGAAATATSDGKIYLFDGSAGGNTLLSTIRILEPNTIVVQDAPLVGSGVPISAFSGQSFSGPVATFTDAGSDAATLPYTNIINWGDGTSSAGTIQRNTDGSFTVSASHTFASPRRFTVQTSVFDTAGARGFFSTTAAVIVPAPNVFAVVPITLVEGIPSATVIAADFTDPHPQTAAGDFVASILWDDGETDQATVQAIPNSAYRVVTTLRNAYPESGSHRIFVTVGYNSQGPDALAGNTAVAQLPVTVIDAPLSDTTASNTLSATAGIDTGQQVVATFSDANPFGLLSDFTAQVDWGENPQQANFTPATVQLVNRTPNAANFEVLADHSYLNPGTYSLHVLVRDKDGQSVFGNGVTTVNVTSGATLSIASDTSWRVYTDAGLTNLRGDAQDVVLGDFSPVYPRPAGAFSYGFETNDWSATTAADDPTGAAWIWAPGISLSDPSYNASYYFTKTFNAATPLSGTISMAADDFAALYVNGQFVGSVR